MLDTVKINHVQHISFTQSRLTDAVSVILSELLSYEHPSKRAGEQKREQKKQMPTDCRHLAWSRRIKKLRYDCKSGRQKRRKQCQTCSKFRLCKNIRKK